MACKTRCSVDQMHRAVAVISDSVPWKEHLLRIADTLEKRKTQARWTERTSFLVERDTLTAAYAVRKMIESHKLSDELRQEGIIVRRHNLSGATSPGLAPKTVKNIHRMLHRAFKDAVAWDYLTFNPTEHASLPRVARNANTRPKPWTVDELAAWLQVALQDRFAALWLLAATTGMRRSELAGIRRDDLDLDSGTLRIADTRVVVDGHGQDSDGKSDASEREISVDEYTVRLLRDYLQVLEKEREAFGHAYPDHGKLMCFADGRRLHPDTVTRGFNRLVDRAGVRRIRLHDVRHTYSTMSIDAGIDPKIVSDRVGHANMNVTFQIYTHRSTGRDRSAAQAIANMIQAALPDQPDGDSDDPGGS